MKSPALRVESAARQPFTLAENGYRVLAAVRKHEDVESLLAEAGSRRVVGAIEPIILDVTDAVQIAAAVEIVRPKAVLPYSDFRPPCRSRRFLSRGGPFPARLGSVHRQYSIFLNCVPAGRSEIVISSHFVDGSLQSSPPTQR
jgi:NAD(P)-dependent dehydrogenase (short-subunit alcohol dehydrogenase family)